jgi:DNA-binding response OmpR family regulator
MSTRTILLADPDPLHRQLIDVLLAEDAYRMVDVGDARAALEYLRHNTPDLMLLAMALPDADGDVVCEKAKSVTRLASVPVILAAPASEELGIDPALRQRARLAGADLLLQKPLGDKNLRERVRALLSSDGHGHAPQGAGTKTTQVIEEALDALTRGAAEPSQSDDAAAEAASALARENAELRLEVASLKRRIGRLEAALRTRAEERDDGVQSEGAAEVVRGGSVARPAEHPAPEHPAADDATTGARAGMGTEADLASLRATIDDQQRQLRQLERRNTLLNAAIEELKESTTPRGLFGRRRT